LNEALNRVETFNYRERKKGGNIVKSSMREFHAPAHKTIIVADEKEAETGERCHGSEEETTFE
jgi:hypothetical protein